MCVGCVSVCVRVCCVCEGGGGEGVCVSVILTEMQFETADVRNHI